MNANEMKYQVLLETDFIFENTAPGYSDIQISAFLNKAQRRVFNEKKKIYDTDEQVKRILSPLNKRASLLGGTINVATETTYTHPNGTFYALPSDLGKITEEFVQFSLLTNPVTYGNPILVYPINYDYYTKNYDNKYKKPYEKLVWRLDYNTESSGSPVITKYVVELITDGLNTIGDYRIAYLRFPTDITVNTVTPASQVSCEILDKNFQDEVVSEATKMIKTALNDEGYQVAVNEKTFDI